MKNQASFPQAKELAYKLLEVFSKLAGNSKSFDPMIEGVHEVVVTKAVERLSAKGKEMKEINFRSLKDGRDAKLYIMKFRKADWKKWENVELGAHLIIDYKLVNGFANVNILEKLGKTDIISKPNFPLTNQTIFLYDIEIFKKDELFVFRDYFTKEWTVINNDLDALRKFYLENRDSLFVGYNSASYDDNVMRATLQGKSSYHVSKTVISSDDRSAVYKLYNMNKTPLFGLDLYQDNRGFSLKEHSAFLGINIKETEVDFDMERELINWVDLMEENDLTTDMDEDELVNWLHELTGVDKKEIYLLLTSDGLVNEKTLNELYCKNDVLATELRFEQNIGMLLAKATIALMFNMDKKALGLTNANLTAEVLGAKRQPVRADLTEPYELDSKLNVTIPEVREAYLNHEFDLNEKGKLNVALDVNRNGYEMVYGSGGLHGARQSYIHIGEFIARDFGSLYPNTMINFDLLSRNIPDDLKGRYGDLLQQRMNAKYNGEKEVTINGVELPTNVMVNGIKLPLNTKFGASGAEFNGLYDPRNQFLVCVTGQLIMTEFYEIIEPHCTLIQSNTDCHMYIPNSKEDEKEMDIKLDEFSKRVGITLDKDPFIAIYQKDVNNYVAIDEKGKVKVKGAIGLTGGLKVSKAVVSNAFLNYVVSGKDYREFINECDELRQFQIISKTGWTFDETIYRDAFGNEFKAQKVNRIFATKNPVDAVELFKVKHTEVADEETDEIINGKAYTKGVPNAPQYYMIDNHTVGEGVVTIDTLDKEYYIQQVEDTLDLWFGSTWKERIDGAHERFKAQGFEFPKVKNYID